jgi:hypothetical protein
MPSLLAQLTDRLVSSHFTLVDRSKRDVSVYDKKAPEGKIRVVIMGKINSIYIYEWYKTENDNFVSQTDFHNTDQERQMERIYTMLSI